MTFETFTSTAQARQAQLIERFEALPDWEARYQHIISLGRSLPAFPESARVDANKVQGCQSQVWLVAAGKATPEGSRVVHFHADSDALLVKGLLAVLLSVFNDLPAAEIVAAPTSFLNQLGLTKHLSMQRNNGLAAVLKQIKLHALALATRESP
jgi:cysteine desulfuration protein SufE